MATPCPQAFMPSYGSSMFNHVGRDHSDLVGSFESTPFGTTGPARSDHPGRLRGYARQLRNLPMQVVNFYTATHLQTVSNELLL